MPGVSHENTRALFMGTPTNDNLARANDNIQHDQDSRATASVSRKLDEDQVKLLHDVVGRLDKIAATSAHTEHTIKAMERSAKASMIATQKAAVALNGGNRTYGSSVMPPIAVPKRGGIFSAVQGPMRPGIQAKPFPAQLLANAAVGAMGGAPGYVGGGPRYGGYAGGAYAPTVNYTRPSVSYGTTIGGSLGGSQQNGYFSQPGVGSPGGDPNLDPTVAPKPGSPGWASWLAKNGLKGAAWEAAKYGGRAGWSLGSRAVGAAVGAVGLPAIGLAAAGTALAGGAIVAGDAYKRANPKEFRGGARAGAAYKQYDEINKANGTDTGHWEGGTYGRGGWHGRTWVGPKLNEGQRNAATGTLESRANSQQQKGVWGSISDLFAAAGDKVNSVFNPTGEDSFYATAKGMAAADPSMNTGAPTGFGVRDSGGRGRAPVAPPGAAGPGFTAPYTGAFVDPMTNPNVSQKVRDMYANGRHVPVVIRNNNPAALSLMKPGSGEFAERQEGYIGATARPANEGGYYAKYATPEHGIAANARLLERYGKNGTNTPDAIVRKWSTDSSAWNAYSAKLQKALGVSGNTVVDLSDKDVQRKILMAKSAHESGAGVPIYDEDTFNRGVNRQFPKIGEMPKGANVGGGMPSPKSATDVISRLQTLKRGGMISNEECVSLAKAAVGLSAGMVGGNVHDWRRGESAESGNLKPGAPVSTFANRDGSVSDRYAGGGSGTPGAHLDHAAVFQKYITDDKGNNIGMTVSEQYRGSGGIRTKDYMFKNGKLGEANGSNYYSPKLADGTYIGGANNPMNGQAQGFDQAQGMPQNASSTAPKETASQSHLNNGETPAYSSPFAADQAWNEKGGLYPDVKNNKFLTRKDQETIGQLNAARDGTFGAGWNPGDGTGQGPTPYSAQNWGETPTDADAGRRGFMKKLQDDGEMRDAVAADPDRAAAVAGMGWGQKTPDGIASPFSDGEAASRRNELRARSIAGMGWGNAAPTNPMGSDLYASWKPDHADITQPNPQEPAIAPQGHSPAVTAGSPPPPSQGQINVKHNASTTGRPSIKDSHHDEVQTMMVNGSELISA